MTPEQIGLWIGILIGGFVVGAICGILPLVLGLKKQRRGLALASWVSCVIAGLILGLILAVPVAIVFTVVILCLKKPEPLVTTNECAEQHVGRVSSEAAPSASPDEPST